MVLVVVDKISCCNLQAAPFPNSTGIGFLDHMLDQFHSHAQVGVGVHVIDSDSDSDATPPSNNNSHNSNTHDHDSIESKVQHHNRFASTSTSSSSSSSVPQQQLMITVGQALGTALRTLLEQQQVPPGQISRFCCPLDEALVECILQTKQQQPQQDEETTTTTTTSTPLTFIYDVAPYGVYPTTPTTMGRSHIGFMETQPLELFWYQVATHADLAHFQLRKIRGENAHHIVESSFKATARALRNLLDQVHTTPATPITITTPTTTTTITTPLRNEPTNNSQLWSVDGDNYQASAALQRTAQTERNTKETSIVVQLHLTPPLLPPLPPHVVVIHTGIVVLDQVLSTLAQAAHMSLTCTCQGDVWVDEHHTSEDVAISLGQVLYEALGTKAGLNRMWCAQARVGGAVVEVTMDLSNRPCLRHNLTLTEDEYVIDPSAGGNTGGDSGPRLTVEMFEHVLDSLVVNGRMTVHIVQIEQGTNIWERAMATAEAFGTALRYCAMVDCRRAGQTASSKGTLSV